MQWRGQGVLVVLVLAGAAAFGYQWKSMTQLDEDVRLNDFEYAPYIRAVANFVKEQKRWPEPFELALPTLKPDGVIKDVELQNNGELLFTLSGWSIGTGHATVLLAPELNTHNTEPHYQRSRLEYSCVEVNPSSLEQVMCMRIGSRSAVEINSHNENAFAEWEKNEAEAKGQAAKRNTALVAATNTETRCDRHLVYAEQEVLPCISRMDEAFAQTLNGRIQETLNSRRLRPEIIVDNPDLLEQFNRDCDENWSNLAGMAKMQSSEIAGCFD
jgi:hypothetical protein